MRSVSDHMFWMNHTRPRVFSKVAQMTVKHGTVVTVLELDCFYFGCLEQAVR